jgi:hypothetical protein
VKLDTYFIRYIFKHVLVVTEPSSRGEQFLGEVKRFPLAVLGVYCMKVELLNGGRDSLVIIATRFKFEGPGFETLYE